MSDIYKKINEEIYSFSKNDKEYILNNFENFIYKIMKMIENSKEIPNASKQYIDVVFPQLVVKEISTIKDINPIELSNKLPKKYKGGFYKC